DEHGTGESLPQRPGLRWCLTRIPTLNDHGSREAHDPSHWWPTCVREGRDPGNPGRRLCPAQSARRAARATRRKRAQGEASEAAPAVGDRLAEAGGAPPSFTLERSEGGGSDWGTSAQWR